MNRIKRICTLLTAVGLAVVMALGVMPDLSVAGAFRKNAEKVTAPAVKAEAAEVVVTDPRDYIYFDLAAGNVTISASTYSGAIYKSGTVQPVSGTHSPENKYYIYQSTAANQANTGYVTPADETNRNCTVPDYPRVMQGTRSWSEYITNNIDVYKVSGDWKTAAENAQRKSTGNRIIFAQDSNYTADVTIDNIWSHYVEATTSRTTGGIGAHLTQREKTHVRLRLKGDNRVGCVHYSADKESGNTIEFYNGDSEKEPGSITAADFSDNWRANHWNAVIGAADNPGDSADMSEGIEIHGGVIYAGATWEDNCTAIGGGGNQYGGVTIKGGRVTAVTAGTGTAIGGGIGYSDQGGDTDVDISGGEIYAYNLGIDYEKTGGFNKFVPAAAIGGGGSNRQAGGLKAVIKISGGTVYAQSMGGPGIGGGGSALAGGGPANIEITGGTVIAKSTGGTYNGGKVDPGVSIGGGTGDTAGGSVQLNISGADTIVRAGSVGGGLATQEGAKVGSAKVTVSGGNIIGQVIMAGGAADPCSFTMTGGVMHSTNVVDGVTIGNANVTGVTVTDPNPSEPLAFRRQNGGAVFINDPRGTATVSGGLIGNCTANKGGAIYMAGGTFTLSGNGALGTNHAKESGGSVYVEEGTVNIKGGAIRNSDAQLSGGGVYVGKGKVNMSGGEIRENTTQENGGGLYVKGDEAQEGGTVTFTGGAIRNNSAQLSGGGMYVDSGKVDIKGGEIRNNTAVKDGGGVFVAGNVHMTGGDVTHNSAEANGGGIGVSDGVVLMYGGSLDHNTAKESGGGLYVSTITKDALVDIFSGSVSDNKAKKGGGIAVFSNETNGIGVTVGVNCAHPGLDEESQDRTFTPFAYPDRYPDVLTPENCGSAHAGHEHYHIQECTHTSCPVVSRNSASEDGGGFYLRSAASTEQTETKTDLTLYCIFTQGNTAAGNDDCYALDVLGGHVTIGDDTYDHNSTVPAKGNIIIDESVLVESGKVDIYGSIENPKFISDISVEIEGKHDYFKDHRVVKTTSEKAYKVHYYENFKGDDGVVVGNYKARQYPDKTHESATDEHKYDFTILASTFSRPGHKIVGWNSKPDNTGDSYTVNETRNLLELEEQGKIITQDGESLFILYAIWERSGYVLEFDPNVGLGETYTGEMKNQTLTVGILDGSRKINANQFKRSGFKFKGWALTASPASSDTIYADQWAITTDFTTKDGAIIVLYAQWEACTHGNLIYTANGNVLTQKCADCTGHTSTATVSAVNSVYDGEVHLAEAVFADNWLGGELTIAYVMAKNDTWDGLDDVDDNWKADPRPLHAGTYTAKIAAGGVEAATEFIIGQTQWQTPSVPQIVFKVDADKKSYIEVTQPTGAGLLYWIKTLDSNGQETIVSDAYANWQTSPQFAGIPFGHYYYFYAKQSGDRDHEESDKSRSEAYLATGGNIVFIKNATGIKVEFSSGTGAFVYTVSADANYHLRNYTDNSATAVSDAKPIENLPAGETAYNNNGISLATGITPDGAYQYSVRFTEKAVAYYQITLEFSGAVKDAAVSHKKTDGEVFRDFNDVETSVSRDSAFTVQFSVSGYFADEYSGQALGFSQALPVGTTVILKDGAGYWYYKFGTAGSSVSLTEFFKMGEGTKFTFPTAAPEGTPAESITAISFTYQFIIDFSQAEENALAGELEVSLILTANPDRSAPTLPAAGSIQPKIAVAQVAQFALTGSVAGKTATLECGYTASEGAASVWNGRSAALVLEAPAEAPADLTVTAVVSGTTVRLPMGAGNRFIVPLGAVGGKSVKVTLNSALFPKTEEQQLVFDAKWYVSQSSADESPLNGFLAASCNVPFACKQDAELSVRVEGTEHSCPPGGTLTVKVHYAGIPEGATVIASLQSKVKGVYEDAALNKDVAITETGYCEVSFDMGQMKEGSYRILVIVRRENANILTVPYYFVIAK